MSMSQAQHITKLVQKLKSDPAPSDAEICDILGLLKKEVVNEALLRETKAGLTVGKLRNHGTASVSDLAKEVVKKWKTEVDRAKSTNQRKGSTSNASASAAAPPIAGTSNTNGSSGHKNGSVTAKGKDSQEPRTVQTDGIKIESTGDATRDRCIELMYNCLANFSGAPSDLILRRAKQIENAVYVYNNSTTTPAYKQKLRSLFVNLKDKSNPGLSESVVSGDIDPEKLHLMKNEELASDARKAENKRIEERNLFASLGAAEAEAETDAFQCGKCKQRKCRYRQAQTRSADEPMTTFVTCVNCGNRWKFS